VEGRDWQGHATTKLLTKNIKMDIKMLYFDVMSKVLKNLEDNSAGISNCYKKSDTLVFCLVFDIKVGKVNFDLARYI
jgi:hypothetical protein